MRRFWWWLEDTFTNYILEKLNFTASYSIIASYRYSAYMDRNDIVNLTKKGGNDIVSHTYSHCNLSTVDATSLQREPEDHRITLRSYSYGADVLIYPYGEAARNETVRTVVTDVWQVAIRAQSGKCNFSSVDRFDVNPYVVYPDASIETFTS